MLGLSRSARTLPTAIASALGAASAFLAICAWAAPEPPGRTVEAALRAAGVEPLATAFLDHPALHGIDLTRSLAWTRDPEANRARTARYGPLVRRGRTAPVRVQPVSPEVGYGLFAGRSIPAGGFVGEYAGELVALPPGRTTDYGWHYPIHRTADGRPVRLVIDAERRGNALRFVNHGAEVNLEAIPVAVDGVWRIVFVATTDIEAGEQLLIDYGEAFWRARGIEPLRLVP